MLAELGFWSWFMIALLAAAVFAVWLVGRRMRRRARENFYRSIDNDTRSLLLKSGSFSKEDIDGMLFELKARPSRAALHPDLLRIEYHMHCKDIDKVNRVLAVAYMDRQNMPIATQIERQYDWDFIPDDLGDRLILADEQCINIELYVKKTQ